MTRADANRLLDFARAGGDVSDADVLFALWVTGDLAWCMDWPEGARVPRINPATGAVTGGVQ